ncbi:MAG: hypothetical protein PSU83_01545, partial [Flavobacterium sp.]|nr:hypothetical protein [Flavobacterium sp.]
MKKLVHNFKFLAVLIVLLSLFGIGKVSAQTNTLNTGGGNWTTAGNWSLGIVPTAAHDVVIPNNRTVTVNTAAVCNTFTISNGNNVGTVTISTGQSLTVSGAVSIGAGTGAGDNKVIAVGSGSFSCASINVTATGNSNRSSGVTLSTGTVTVDGDVTMGDANDDFTFTNTGTLNIGGTMSGGTFTASTGTVNYNGTGAQSIGTYTYNNLTTSTSGIKTLPTGSLINGIVRVQATSTLEYGAANLIGTGAFQLNGGTFSTGATAGFTDTVGVLTLLEDSNIKLGTGNHTLTFANSSGASWTAGKKLTITGWLGGYNGTAAGGTNPKLFVGTANTHLTTAQKAQIQFFNGTSLYAATQLASGEVVPTATLVNGLYSFSPTSVCPGGSITITGLGFTGASVVRVNGVAVSSFTVVSNTTITAILTTSNTTGLVTVINGANTYNSLSSLAVIPSPTAVTAAASAAAICNGGSVDLTSSATSNSATATTLLTQNFNGTPAGWTTTNTSTGGTPANAAWTLRANGYNDGNETFNSNDTSQFYLSNSDSQGTGGTTNTTLTSPAFSTLGMGTATLSFYHYYRFNGTESANVDISTDGINWTLGALTYTSTQGARNGFVQATLNLSSFLNQPAVYVRFRYVANFDWYWAIDNVTVTSTPATPAISYAWTSTPGGYTSSTQNPTGVSPTVNTTYTVTATNNYGCTATATTATVTVTPLNTIAAGINVTNCFNSAITTITLATTGATGATFSGLPAGVSGSWSANVVTISGTPTASGAFNYTVTTTGGCPPATTTGTITVTPLNTIAAGINVTNCF